MLVLTRKRTESIKIGDDVIIRVMDLGTKTVRIGIEAPPRSAFCVGNFKSIPR